MVTGVWVEGEKWVLLFNGYRVSHLQNEKMLEMFLPRVNVPNTTELSI